MQPCHTDLTTAETFSGRSSHRKGALGNRSVPVIWAKIFLPLASELQGLGIDSPCVSLLSTPDAQPWALERNMKEYRKDEEVYLSPGGSEGPGTSFSWADSQSWETG